MSSFHRIAIVAALALAGACGGNSGAAPAEADKRPDKAEGAEAKAETKDAAAPDDAKGAQSVQPVNPHAMGGSIPLAATQAQEPKGEPRDIEPSGELAEIQIDELKVPLPKEWEKQTPSSRMRKAQYALPGPGGDAELVVFRFPGGAGGIEANLDRWKGQFSAPEGKTLDDISTTKTFDAGKLKVHYLDVSGHFVAAMQPGMPAKHDDPDYRMLAAIVEGSGDPVFIKTTGPKQTMDVWAEAYEAMLIGIAIAE